MSDNKKTPEIRFKGFTEDWKQRKLLEVANYRNGKAHEQDILEDGAYVVVNSKFVSTDGLVMKFSNKQNEPLMKDEIAFVLSDVPNGKAIAKTFLVDKSMKYTLNQRIAAITPLDHINPKYLAITMNRHKYFLQFDDGVKQTNLSLNDMINYENYYPEKKEQDKIGMLFTEIDNLITLHQCKYHKLVSFKQSMLEKMLPKNSFTIPEIRFKGFTEDWEQRKLRKIIKYKNGRGHEESQLNSGKYELINLNSISIDGGLKESGKYINDSNETLKKDDIVMVLSDVGHGDLLGRVALIPENNRFVLNQRVALLRILDKTNPRFLFFTINANQHYFKVNGAGSSQLNIPKSVVENCELMIPKNEEQLKIANYLTNLDHLITLHQHKLEKLKNIKKSLLTKMFV